jgi:hypothetical protein
LKPIEYNTFIIAHDYEQTFEGYLYADGANNISIAMATLENAIKAPGVDVSLVNTVSGATQHTLINSGAIGGDILKDFKFVDTPLHMATHIKFQMTVGGIYANSQQTRNVVSLVETIRIQGDGGPEITLADQAGLKSIYQEIKPYTNVNITQSGKIVSRNGFSSLPAPVIALADAKISKNSGLTKSYTQRGTMIWLYQQDYSYSFQLPELPGSPVVPTYLV